MKADDEIARYVDEVVGTLTAVLADELLGAYLGGSLALGGFVQGRSDVDIAAVCYDSLSQEQKRLVVEALSRDSLPCPTRGLELVVYPRASVASAARAPRFVINLNTGPRVPLHASFDPTSKPSHWFVLDLAIIRDKGVRILGPPVDALFAPIPRPWVLDALLDSLQWHAEHEAFRESSVLNACRAWRYAEEGVWSSKDEAGAWARERVPDRAIVDRALAMRRGQSAELEPARVLQFLGSVRTRIEAAR